VLSVIAQSGTDFFLTGGTALSRGYYNHRYSDDLDFFLNSNERYDELLDKILDSLKENGFFWSEEKEEGFVRNGGFCSLKIEWKKSDVKLKLDFVNDIAVRFGEIESKQVFYRIDSIENILTNKLSAIFRYSIKDISDIREISLHNSFNWIDMCQKAGQKDAGVELSIISSIIATAPKEEFEKINWVKNPTWEVFYRDIQTIAQDMVNARDNTLCG
jgi:hypothetical protein